MRIGVMQGRLVPPEGGRFQSFPQAWRDEFKLASQAGVDYIEWIVDSQPQNPIFTVIGRSEMAQEKWRWNIKTPAICADWFMEHPLREDFYQWKQRLQKLQDIAPEIRAKRIIIPFVDNSSIKTIGDLELVVKALENTDDEVEIHLETDLPPILNAQLIQRLPCHCKANWDSGNSSGLGYIASEEFDAYGQYIGSIHIKDRLRLPDGKVETKSLGEGSADFEDVFASIARIRYDGDLTLQVARGADGDEVDWIRRQTRFVRERLKCLGK